MTRLPALILLHKPLSPGAAVAAVVTICGAVALYCLTYSWLAGRTESARGAVVWALVNVAPWIATFEVGKRIARLAGLALLLVAAFTASMVLELVLQGIPHQVGFELIRRVPALLLVTALLALARFAASGARSPPASDLPLLPGQIDWVAACGNYVELHAGGRVIVHRMTLREAEARLCAEEFVRIRRSTLVRRAAIARVRKVDLILRDGTHLKIGSKFRYRLVQARGDSRPFVPAE